MSLLLHKVKSCIICRLRTCNYTCRCARPENICSECSSGFVCGKCNLEIRVDYDYSDLTRSLEQNKEFTYKEVIYRGTKLSLPFFLQCRSCPRCRIKDRYSDLLLLDLKLQRVISLSLFKDLSCLCYRCVIDVLIFPTRLEQECWDLWTKENNYLTWPPEEVLKDICLLLPKRYKIRHVVDKTKEV